MPQSIALNLPIVAYILAIFWVLYRVLEKKEATTAEAYALGNLSYRRRVVFLTMAATMIGPAYSIGAVEESRTNGFLYIGFFLLVMLQIFLVGTFFAARIKAEAGPSRTVGDILGKYYDKPAKLFTGLATVGQALAFTGVLCLGAAKILEAIWGVPTSYGIVATAVVVGAYAAVGGMPAVLRTDSIQFGLLVLVLFVGLAACFRLLSQPEAALPTDFFWRASGESFPTSKIVSTSIAFLLGEAFIPIYSVRGLLAKDGPIARAGFRWAAYFGVVWFICLGFFGLTSHVLAPEQQRIGIVLFDVVAQVPGGTIIANLAIGLTAAAILGIVMSTLDSVLNAGAVALSRDVVEVFVDLSEEEEFSLDKFGLWIIAIFGSGFTIFSDNLVDLLLIGYTIWVPTVVFPFAYALVRKAGAIKSRRSAAAGILAGIFGFFVGQALNSTWMPPILIGLILNIIVFALVEEFARKDISAATHN